MSAALNFQGRRKFRMLRLQCCVLSQLIPYHTRAYISPVSAHCAGLLLSGA